LKNTPTRKKESVASEATAGDFVPSATAIKWSVLANSGEDEVKLYYENVTGSGLKPISVDVIIGETTYANLDLINVTHINLEIEKVISNQMSTNTCNQLPTAYYGGENNNPMFMSTRSDGKAYLGMTVSLAGHANIPDKILIGMRLVETQNQPLEAETRIAVKPALTPAVTYMHFSPDNPSSDIAARYEAVWGWDSNSDGKLQTIEVMGHFDKTPFLDDDGKTYTGSLANRKDLIYIITESQVNFSKNALLSNQEIWWNPGYSADFIEFFVTADMSEITDEAGSSNVITPVDLKAHGDKLSHPLGAKWKSTCNADTFRAEFDNDSGLSNKIEASTTMDVFLAELAENNKAALAVVAPSVGSEGWKYISFNDRVMFFKLAQDKDLYYSLKRTEATGGVNFKVTRFVDGGVEKLDIELESMAFFLEDTYDFAYGASALPRQAAIVQSGHASDHGAAGIGKVFFNKVFIDEDPTLILPNIIVLTP